ncbi:MAG: AAA family ATPase [Spirochaetales bacterium]|nr:AAA family ATPase [Spirochaetales bacterium]
MASKKQLSVQSIRRAALELHRWRKANDSQGAMHLIHLLAAKLAGARQGNPIPYTEQSVDFSFCDRFLRVNESDRPYFDPLDMNHRIGTHPHSNVATARKKTFSDKWQAGKFSVENGTDYFTLQDGYVDTLVEKMGKRGHYTKLNPVAIACWLYREHDWPDNTTVSDIVRTFCSEFNFDDDEWAAFFVSDTDKAEAIYGQWSHSQPQEISKTIIDVLSRDVEGFNVFHSLMAIREVCKMPVITVSQIIETMRGLKCKQVVIQGPPGTGKTYLAKQVASKLIDADLAESRSQFCSTEQGGRWGILQLHPSYGYEDFIQRMVPKQEPGGGVRISIEDMPFILACKIASSIAPDPFVLIVDEMNRADLQKVFGELMYALEYRNEPVTLQYSKQDLVIPSNLYLVGTMNTADSSVVQVDYAIRRRFIFFDAPPDRQVIDGVVSDLQVKKAGLALFDATNSACDNHPRFSIGHSYFLHSSMAGMIGSFVYQVLPVLRAFQDNGVMRSDAAIHLTGWDSEPITPSQTRPDVLVDALSSWAAGLL